MELALASVRHQLIPLNPADRNMCAVIVTALTRAVTLLSPHLDEAKKEDWVTIAIEELAGEPMGLVLDAATAARRICKFPSEFVPTVIAIVEPKKARLVAQAERYERLEALTR